MLQRLLGREKLFQNFFGFVYNAYQGAVNNKVFTAEEIIEHGAAMAEAAPRDGHAWGDLATVFHRQKKYAEALPFWDKAIDVMDKKPNVFGARRSRLGKADSLLSLKRTDEAIRLIEGTTYENTNKNHWKALERVRKALKLPALKKPPEEKKPAEKKKP